MDLWSGMEESTGVKRVKAATAVVEEKDKLRQAQLIHVIV